MENVGLDVGFRYLKVDRGNGSPIVLPSVIAPHIPGGFAASLGGQAARVITYQDKSYVVGDVDQNLQVATTDHSRLSTDEFIVLALAGLSATFGKGVTANVVTGLPHNWMTHAKRVKTLLLGEHNIVAGRKQKFQIANAEVVPQAFGTIVDQALIINGDGIKIGNVDILDNTTLVIDFGGGTVNWAAMRGKSYDGSLSDSKDLGMTRVLSRLRQAMIDKHEIDYSIPRLDQYVREGSIPVYDARIPVDGLIKPLVDDLLPAILAHTRTLWNTGRFSNTVLLTGGGTRWFGPAFSEQFGHPNTIIVGDSQISNARGMRKYALWLTKTNNW